MLDRWFLALVGCSIRDSDDVYSLDTQSMVGWEERKDMTFDVVFMLFLIVLLLAAILAAIMAYPGPKKQSR